MYNNYLAIIIFYFKRVTQIKQKTDINRSILIN